MEVFASKAPSHVVVDATASEKKASPSRWYLIAVLAIVLILLLFVLFRVQASSSEPQIQTASVASDGNITIRIYNGWTIADIDSALSQRKLSSEGSFIKAAQAVADSRGLPFAEGFFLAGDYTVSKGDGFASELAAQMAQKFMETAKPLFPAISESGMSLADFAIIASMMSAETKNAEEYPVISSIIHNRLSSGMPLGIDATTRYETGNWTEPLSSQVLDKKTPYNTRRKTGLPPTGICCPSEESLRAAVLPDQTDYLYYRHDSSGQIHYSLTYEEHQESQKENP
jgi:UPF0755 protein